MSRARRTRLSVVTPAYNEQDNLPVLYERLRRTLEHMDVDWEWIVVDDHSGDATFSVLGRLAEADDRVRGLRFSRNFGSHYAILCGLRQARGDAAVVLAGDLQDPPETIPDLAARWQQGGQVVWAARRRREGEDRATRGFSRVYWAIMRHLVGLKDLPAGGADFFLMDRAVIDAFAPLNEGNTSVIHLVSWMGFRQEVVHYDKQARLHGRSGWSLWKKIKVAIDSVTAFSYLPIRVMSLAGIGFAVLGAALAAFLVWSRFTGRVIAGTGYVAIMIVLLLGFGFVMTFLGVLGEYLWRTLDEVRGRPRYLVEAVVGGRRGPRGAERGSAALTPVEHPSEELEPVAT